MKLIIDMPWGPNLSVNDMRFGRPAPGQKFRRRKPEVQGWMDRLAWEVWIQRGGAGAWTEGIMVTVDFRFPDKRRHDTHNYYKVICDAVAGGLGIDDKNIRPSVGTVDVDRDNAGFTITVEDEAK